MPSSRFALHYVAPLNRAIVSLNDASFTANSNERWSQAAERRGECLRPLNRTCMLTPTAMTDAGPLPLRVVASMIGSWARDESLAPERFFSAPRRHTACPAEIHRSSVRPALLLFLVSFVQCIVLFLSARHASSPILPREKKCVTARHGTLRAS